MTNKKAMYSLAFMAMIALVTAAWAGSGKLALVGAVLLGVAFVFGRMED